MNAVKLSKRDAIMILLLALIIIGTVYYMAFYTPLQNDLASIANQSSELDAQIAETQGKLKYMNEMKAELEEIFSRPKEEITEIAPYNNAKNIMNFLHGILGSNYEMSSPDPIIDSDGTVRRKISLSFTCEDYASAKAVLKSLASWNYRCLLEGLNISGDSEEGIEEGEIKVSVAMTFFESTNLA